MGIRRLMESRRFRRLLRNIAILLVVAVAIPYVDLDAIKVFLKRSLQYKAQWSFEVHYNAEALNYKTGRMGNYACPWWRPRDDLHGFLTNPHTREVFGDVSNFDWRVTEEDLPIATVYVWTDSRDASVAAIKKFREEFFAYLERERKWRDSRYASALQEGLSCAKNEDEAAMWRKRIEEIDQHLNEYHEKTDFHYVDCE